MSDIVIGDRVLIPSWVDDFSSFRRWIQSDECPDHGWYSHLNGQIWVDIAMEKAWHNKIKGIIAIVLGSLVLSKRLGEFFHDRMYLTHPAVGFSTEPDGMFLSEESLSKGLVKLLAGDESVEVIGTPDMTLEVVSPSSTIKDTEVLRDLYWEAGISEYWLVQPVGDDFDLDILRRTAAGYTSTRKNQGWVKSKVFGQSFRLTRKSKGASRFTYLLEMR